MTTRSNAADVIADALFAGHDKAERQAMANAILAALDHAGIRLVNSDRIFEVAYSEAREAYVADPNSDAFNDPAAHRAYVVATDGLIPHAAAEAAS